MISTQHEISSEVAYDLFQDHMNLILELLNGPLDVADVHTRLASPHTLSRLIAQGLVTLKGDEVHAVASVYHQLRQEGMMSFLERYVLPSLNATTSHSEDLAEAILINLFLNLQLHEKTGLRSGAVHSLLESLCEISERPTSGPLHRMTVLVLGTSAAFDPELPRISGDALALENLRCAALQRSSPAERDEALMIQFDCLADAGRYQAAFARIHALQKELTTTGTNALQTTGSQNYRLTLAAHWQGPAPHGTDRKHPRNLC